MIAAETEAAADEQLELTRRARAKNLFGRGDRRLSDEEVEEILRSPQAAAVDEMLTYTAVGTPQKVADYVDDLSQAERRRRADHRPLREHRREPGPLDRTARGGRRPGGLADSLRAVGLVSDRDRD